MRTLLALLFCLLLFKPGLADDTLRLSKEDAKQLHAFLLRDELLDFGERAESASAYLMAAELFLDYPPGEVPKERIVALSEKALSLANGDEFLEGWVDRILLRNSKVERGLVNQFQEKWAIVSPGESYTLDGEFQAGWLLGERLELQILDSKGAVLRTGSTLSSKGLEATSSLTWRVANNGQSEQRFRLLLCKK